MTTIKLDGNTLSSTEISLVANGARVEVAIDAWGKVELARDVVCLLYTSDAADDP